MASPSALLLLGMLEARSSFPHPVSPALRRFYSCGLFPSTPRRPQEAFASLRRFGLTSPSFPRPGYFRRSISFPFLASRSRHNQG